MDLWWGQSRLSYTQHISFNWLKHLACHHISTPTIPKSAAPVRHRLWSYFHHRFRNVWSRCGVDEVKQATAMLIDGVPVTRCRTFVTSVSVSTAIFLCGRMFSERRRAVSLPSASYITSVDWYRRPLSRRWRSLLSTNGWTTGTARWLAFQRTSYADCSQLWTLRHGSSSILGALITSLMHLSVCIGANSIQDRRADMLTYWVIQ